MPPLTAPASSKSLERLERERLVGLVFEEQHAAAEILSRTSPMNVATAPWPPLSETSWISA